MEHEFNIGDRVRVVDRRPENVGGNPYWVPAMDETLGKEGIIISFGLSAGSLRVRFNDGNTWAYKPSWLIPAETRSETVKPISPFKPGDMVRVKPLGYIRKRNFFGFSDGMRTLAGKIITIERYDPEDNSYLAARHWWSPNCFEPVETEHTSEQAVPMRSLPSADKLPLIDPTKLLTNIKLD